ncbi:MAG: hypothetical protein L6R28_21410 [Planctomycetes bacterium]|nr:hypothetical protein [Planctomycetota bacterium]
MRTTLLSLLLVVALPGGHLEAKDAADTEAPKPRPVLRVYDVATLCESLTDFPGPELMPNGPVSAQGAAVAAAPAAQITAASIADMIRQRVDPDKWDPMLGTSIEERAGRLTINQFPDIHAKIAKLLEVTQKNLHRTVGIQALLIEPPAEALKDYLNRAGHQVTQANVDALLKDGKLLAMPQILLHNAARSHLFSGSAVSYVAGATAGQERAEPDVEQAFAGVGLDVRPYLNDDATAASIELRFTATERATTAAQTEVAAPLKQKNEHEGTGKKGEPPAAQEVAVERYRTQSATVQGRTTRLTVDAPLGKWVLASILAPAGTETPGGGGQALLLVMVTLP